MVYFTVDSGWLLLVYFIVMVLPKGMICSWNNDHQHINVFNSALLNRVLECFYGLHTGAVSNIWVLHHNVGHHRFYLDQEKDQSRWKNLKRDETMGYWRYSFEVWATSYYRAWNVASGNKNYHKLRRDMVVYGSIVVMVVIGLVIYKPLAGLLLFTLPMFISLWLTAQATYKHHSGLDTGDKYAASRTSLNRFWNFITGNLGYHTAHHIKPNLHWSELPLFHDSIKDKIPVENIDNKLL